MEGERAPVFLTGASGFVGGHVLAALLDAGHPVRALVRRVPARWPSDERLTAVVGDLLQTGELARAMAGCRYLVHVAALYSFAPRDATMIRRVNVEGTAGLLEAARLAGVEKAVVTSSSATVGPAPDGRPATELDHALGGHGADRPGSGYHESKVEQELVALAARVPVVLVLPTAPVGPGDALPTPTGRMVLDVVAGRMPATVRGGMNLVPVEDVGRGHVLALERGRPGERYLLAGEDLTLDEIFSMIAELAGGRPPRIHLPHRLVLSLARLDDLRCRVTGGVPRIPLEGARMSATLMYASAAKATRELGWRPSSVPAALQRAIEWYRASSSRDSTGSVRSTARDPASLVSRRSGPTTRRGPASLVSRGSRDGGASRG
ncbi:MAG: NAD-dependent epimerase/dehydratase family protein [Candidatus Dormiibacterota bacterium]